MIYTCPTPLPDVPNMACEIKYGQIQKIAFQRIGQRFSLNDIQTLSAWTAFADAVDVSKLVVTPYVEAPTVDGGDELAFGGGNNTLDGIKTVMGINPVGMSFVLRNYPQTLIAALKHLMTYRDLACYFFNNAGQVLALRDGGFFYPIPIRAFFVGDLQLHGLEQPSSNIMSFSFKANYSDKLAIAKPDFNPITDIKNADHYIGDGSFGLAFDYSYAI